MGLFSRRQKQFSVDIGSSLPSAEKHSPVPRLLGSVKVNRKTLVFFSEANRLVLPEAVSEHKTKVNIIIKYVPRDPCRPCTQNHINSLCVETLRGNIAVVSLCREMFN